MDDQNSVTMNLVEFVTQELVKEKELKFFSAHAMTTLLRQQVAQGSSDLSALEKGLRNYGSPYGGSSWSRFVANF